MSLLPGSLTVPITIFNKRPPAHRICQLCILPNFRTIISGTLDGQICIWAAENEKEFWPKYLLFGHTTSITCLAAAGVDEISTNFVSCAQSGKICLWDADDGRCIESTYTNYVHTSIQAHRFTATSPPPIVKESAPKSVRILCIGHYSEILVVDPESLQILFSLASRVEPDWISAFNVIKPPHKPDIVVGVSNAGMVKIWTIGSVENKTVTCPVYEDESKQVQCFGACSLILCRFNPRTMLIVCQKLWQVFDAFDFSLCCSGKSDGKGNWLGGDFITVDKIVVWASDGCAYLCQLPKGPLIHDGQDSNSKKFDPNAAPFYYCVLNLNGTNNTGKAPAFVDAPFVYANADFFSDPTTTTTTGRRAILARGENNGRLSVWAIPHVDDKRIEALKQENFDRLPVVPPNQDLSLENLWKENFDQCPGILDCYENLEKNDVSISTTLYMASRGNLVLGRRDGSVVIVSGVRTLTLTFLDLDDKILSERPPILRLISVHNGPVTCILYPHEEHKRYESNYLVTGGADFAVCLIDLHTDTILYRFCVQAGEILRLTVPPPSCTSKVSQSVCSVASDHSVALLGLKDQRCVLLASRHLFPVSDVKFRPLDDFLLVRCEDNTVYVWQIETANLDRVLNGRVAEEAIAACKDQLRAVIIEEKAELEASKRPPSNTMVSSRPDLDWRRYLDETPPMTIQGLRCSELDSEFHVVLFNVESLIISILTQNMAQTVEKPQTTVDSVSYQSSASSSPRLTSFLNKARDAAGTMLNASPLLNRGGSPAPNLGLAGAAAPLCDKSTNLNYEIGHFLLSILQTWNCESNMDNVTDKKLGLRRPKRPVPYGLVSKEGHLTLMLPTRTGAKSLTVERWPSYRYTISGPLTTQHLLAQVSLADACSTADGLAFQDDYEKIRRNLKHQNSRSSNSPSMQRRTDSGGQQNLSSDLLEKFLTDQNQVKQAWNTVASVHCLLLADLIQKQQQNSSNNSSLSYKPPSADLLARRWRDRCPQIRDAAQTLLLRELNRIGADGRRSLIRHWAQFLPAVQNPSLSILSTVATPFDQMSAVTDCDQNYLNAYSFDKTMNIGGPLAPFSSNEPVIRLTRRNQASAVILLGVLGAEYGQDLAARKRSTGGGVATPPTGVEGFVENDFELARVTSQSLLELLLQPPSFVLPPFAALRRAAVDLLGRGFTVWQPHLDISKVLLALLELCAEADRLLPSSAATPATNLPLTPEADACMASRRALTLIASARPPAFITALSKEVTRFNAMSQHQTVHVGSPLIRSKTEILRIIEMIADKNHTDIVDLMLPTSEILIHCMDQSLLKRKSLVEMFPFLANFPMVSYCNQSRKLGFGSKTGVVVVYELRLGKSQAVQAHSKAVTACSFSEDGKYLVTYSADEGKLNFWQLTQSFMGMGQSQVKCLKQYSAPAAFAMGANAQPLITKLTWVAAKAVILTLANGSEHRFSF